MVDKLFQAFNAVAEKLLTKEKEYEKLHARLTELAMEIVDLEHDKRLLQKRIIENEDKNPSGIFKPD